MKRNEIRVPAFDDIIFENRNKEYGAYDLRKRYKSTTILSILSVITFCALLFTLISALTPDEVIAEPEKRIIIVVTPDNTIDPNKIVQPPPEKPVQVPAQNRYVAPDVASDSSVKTSYLLTTEEINLTTKDGDVNDTTNKINFEQPAYEIPDEPPTIFVKVEEMPEFPGGDKALLEFIAKNTIYPDEALKNNIQGRVILKFVVNPSGAVDRIEILRSIDPLLDQEAIRVVGSLPKFKPGKQRGVPVPVWYSVPVNFQLINY
jgi:periplasmic protein TonB